MLVARYIDLIDDRRGRARTIYRGQRASMLLLSATHFRARIDGTMRPGLRRLYVTSSQYVNRVETYMPATGIKWPRPAAHAEMSASAHGA